MNNYENELYNANKNVFFDNTNPINKILSLNKGKMVKVYTNEQNTFGGILEDCASDYIIVSDPKTGFWHLILTKYLNHIDFDEKIDYNNY